MGHIDDFIVAQITPELLQGEQLAYTGLVRNPLKLNQLGVPAVYEDWLAGATNLRLFLFRTKPSGVFSVTPEPLRLEDAVWWYQELREVTTGTVRGVGDGLTFGLIPHEPLGAFSGKSKRYDVISSAKGVDGQQNLYQYFGNWLQQQVVAGVYPLDETRQARIAQHYEQLQREAAEKQAAAEEKKRLRQEKLEQAKAALKGGGALLIAAIVCLLASLAGFGMAGYEYSRIADKVERVREIEARAKDPERGDREFQASLAQDERERLADTRTMSYLYAGGGGALLIPAILLFVLYRKKKK